MLLRLILEAVFRAWLRILLVEPGLRAADQRVRVAAEMEALHFVAGYQARFPSRLLTATFLTNSLSSSISNLAPSAAWFGQLLKFQPSIVWSDDAVTR